jgi:voltage-gated sodium channel
VTSPSPTRSAWSAPFARLADDARFQDAIVGVIVLNALVLAVETFAGAVERYSEALRAANLAFTAIFVVEIAIRILAYGSRPQDFFRRGWNVFDFLIIAALFLPGVRENAALLRLLRLLRVARLLRYLPDVRVLLRGIARAIRPAVGLAVLTILLLFLYGMGGWVFFAAIDPERWGNVAVAMLSLFQILTLEGWNELFSNAFDARPVIAVVFFLSFIVVGTFLVLNLLLGIVLASLEEVRDEELERRSLEDARDDEELARRLREARTALEAAERALRMRADEP